MKAKLNYLILLLFLLPISAKAQGVIFTSFVNDTSQFEVCQLNYSVEISPITNNYTAYGDANLIVDGSNILNSTLTATVDWGDGSVTTHTGTALTSGTAIVWSPSISHSYPSAGIYTYSIDLFDPVSTDSIILVQDAIIGACPLNMFTSTSLDCDGDGIIDSTGLSPDMIITGANGHVYTGSQLWQSIYFYGVLAGSYTVTVDPNWLAANGYTVQSISPDSLTVGVSHNNAFTTQIILNCDTTTSNSNCLYGQAFCDANNNGILDSLEMTSIHGMPITLHLPNGTTYSTQTDSLGLYSFLYSGPVSGGYIQVDQFYLTINGYSLSPFFIDTISSLDCSTQPTINIPLDCGNTTIDTNCVTGYVFCDDNNNGIMDSTEATIGNAPMSLVLSDGTLNLNISNPDGSFSFNYLNPGNLTGNLFVHYDWLDSMGYAYSPYNNTITNASCSNNVISNIPIICDTTSLAIGCVTGVAYCDANGNSILDSNEVTLSNAPITLSGNGIMVTVYTDSNGFYSYTGWQLGTGTIFFSVDAGWQANNGSYLVGNGPILQSLSCNNINIVHIPFTCGNSNSSCADLWTTVTPWIGYYQNTTNSILLKYGNNGQGAPGNYTLTLDYPTGVTPITTTINNPNYTISGNTITWTLNSNNTFMYHSDVIYFNTPAGIPDSTFHLFSSTITPDSSDCDSTNNYSTLGMYVGVSYDPNDKSVNKPLIVNPAVQDEYTYVIRFQNTGTAPAQDIFILDTLSTNLDWSTFELLEVTHNMQLIDLGNGVRKFDFPQIWLPDSTTNEPASHGHIVYRIKEKASLGEGDIVENTAYIYFDQNPPIITNTTKNINTTSTNLGITSTGNVAFLLYPNPANNILNIRTESDVNTIMVSDLSGKIVFRTNADNQMLNNIDISSLSPGIYHLEVNTTEGIGRSTFIKQ